MTDVQNEKLISLNVSYQDFAFIVNCLQSATMPFKAQAKAGEATDMDKMILDNVIAARERLFEQLWEQADISKNEEGLKTLETVNNVFLERFAINLQLFANKIPHRE